MTKFIFTHFFHKLLLFNVFGIVHIWLHWFDICCDIIHTCVEPLQYITCVAAGARSRLRPPLSGSCREP